MGDLWKGREPLVLASSSATRLDLLQNVDLPVDVLPAAIDERAVEAEFAAERLSPREVALRLARAKGAEVSARAPGRWVIAADQTLALDDVALHKPADRDEARAQLIRLSGRTHSLNSAVVCVLDGVFRFEHVDTALMTMRPLGGAFLDAYLTAAGDAVTRSVGAYQAEGLGAHLFERIEGAHATILGLPLLPLLAFLRSAGLVET
jgi:septum formation protein